MLLLRLACVGSVQPELRWLLDSPHLWQPPTRSHWNLPSLQHVHPLQIQLSAQSQHLGSIISRQRGRKRRKSTPKTLSVVCFRDIPVTSDHFCLLVRRFNVKEKTDKEYELSWVHYEPVYELVFKVEHIMGRVSDGMNVTVMRLRYGCC